MYILIHKSIAMFASPKEEVFIDFKSREHPWEPITAFWLICLEDGNYSVMWNTLCISYIYIIHVILKLEMIKSFGINRFYFPTMKH